MDAWTQRSQVEKCTLKSPARPENVCWGEERLEACPYPVVLLNFWGPYLPWRQQWVRTILTSGSEGTQIFRGGWWGNETKESKHPEVVQPLFNIRSDKHVSSSEMPVVGAAVKTGLRGGYGCLWGDYSAREKLTEFFIFPWIKIWQRPREGLFPRPFQS